MATDTIELNGLVYNPFETLGDGGDKTVDAFHARRSLFGAIGWLVADCCLIKTACKR